MRTRDKRIFTQRNVGSAVAADVGHDGARGVVFARVAADGGAAGSGDLVLFARHFFGFVVVGESVWLSCEGVCLVWWWL